MAFLGWLLRAIVAAVVLRFVLRYFFGDQPSSPRSRPRRPAKPSVRAGGTLVRDPQCGTYISPNRALSIGSGDQAHYFCSSDCRDAYRAADRRPHVS